MEIKTKTIERKYINVDNKSVPVSKLLDFIEIVMGSSRFNSVRVPSRYRNESELLLDMGLIGRTNRGNVYEKNKKNLTELFVRIHYKAYDVKVKIENFR